MLIFLGWSGAESKNVALALKQWLPFVSNVFEPWISEEVTKGTRWGPEIAAKLNQSKVGIFCLTPESLDAPWINFEAGAVSNGPPNAMACTFLVRLKPASVTSGPLAQFQHTIAGDQEDTRKLVHDLQAKAKGEGPLLSTESLNKAFDRWWPDLQSALASIKPDSEAGTPRPSPEAMIEEVLDTVREIVDRDRKRAQQEAFVLEQAGRLKWIDEEQTVGVFPDIAGWNVADMMAYGLAPTTRARILFDAKHRKRRAEPPRVVPPPEEPPDQDNPSKS